MFKRNHIKLSIGSAKAALLRYTGVFVMLSAAAVISFSSVAARPNAPVPIPRDGQAYFGVQLDWSNDTIDNYSGRLGRTPAIYGRYVNFPLSPEDLQSTNADVQQLAAHHSMLMLTLQPWPGLSSVTPANVKALTKQLKAWNVAGTPVLVRFAHEMNGSWYPWGQRPDSYIKAYRQVAVAVHQAPKSAMLWSPNDGGGYPFAGGPYEAKPGTADFAALDTNHDGTLTMADDPYTPYYPGDSYVDWVGLSLYHFGNVYPWGDNVIPEQGKFIAKLTGTYKSAYVDETMLPDFYTQFAVNHNKPFALSETSSFYNASNNSGASNYDIKSAWWQQLFDPSLETRFPRMKMVVWFEFEKQEHDTGNADIDWRVTTDPTMDQAFKAAIPSRFIFAQ